MTNCPRPEDLYLYLEGQLGPYKARALEEHVEACADCRAALAERRLLHEAFTTLPPFDVPADFARSVMAGLPEPEVVRGGWLAPLAAAAAALAVGLIGFSLHTGTGLSDILFALNRFCGSAAATVLPLGAKVLKTAEVLVRVSSGAASTLVGGVGAILRSVGLPGVALAVGLGGALFLLVLFGARRFLALGERS